MKHILTSTFVALLRTNSLSETSVINYQSRLHNILGEQRSYLRYISTGLRQLPFRPFLIHNPSFLPFDVTQFEMLARIVMFSIPLNIDQVKK